MEEEGPLLKVTENPLKELTMLWVMSYIYNKAKKIAESLPTVKQKTEETLATFKPTERNLPEQIEDLKSIHQALIESLENDLSGQITPNLFPFLEELKNFDEIVEQVTQAVEENNIEAITASTATDIILGEMGIDEVSTRFRTYTKELVLDLIDENGTEFLDENAEKGLFKLAETGNIIKILKLLKSTDTELRARRSELGETLVNDILEIRAKIRGQHAEPILTPEERAEETFETAFDEEVDEEINEKINKGTLSLDTIERLLSGLSAKEEIVIRMRNGIKKIRIRTKLKGSHGCSTLSAEDLTILREIEENARRFLSEQRGLDIASEEKLPKGPSPDNVTPLFPKNTDEQ